MAQYLEGQEPSTRMPLLFYRMGDYYELFFDEPWPEAAAALDIALTKRGKHAEARISPCAAWPHLLRLRVSANGDPQRLSPWRCRTDGKPGTGPRSAAINP